MFKALTNFAKCGYEVLKYYPLTEDTPQVSVVRPTGVSLQ